MKVTLFGYLVLISIGFFTILPLHFLLSFCFDREDIPITQDSV